MYRRWASWLAVAAVALAGCSTDVDVNAPYQERAVIYSVLDAAQPRQMIRLERAFLNGAQKDVDKILNIPDSLYYARGIVKVVLYPLNVSRADTLVLQDSLQATKDTGVFYAPELVTFYTPPGAVLNPIYKYQVQVTNERTGYKATATTNLIAPFVAEDVIVPQSSDPSLPGPLVLSPIVPEVRIKFPSVRRADGSIIRGDTGVTRGFIRLTIPVEEVLANGQVAVVNVPWQFLADQPLAGSGGSPSVSARYAINIQNGVRYYELFETLLRSLDTNKVVQSRRILPITIQVGMANRLLDRYIQANRSFSAVTQTAPFFSNVNNGIGLVGSRTLYSFQAIISDYRAIATQTRYRGLKL